MNEDAHKELMATINEDIQEILHLTHGFSKGLDDVYRAYYGTQITIKAKELCWWCSELMVLCKRKKWES